MRDGSCERRWAERGADFCQGGVGVWGRRRRRSSTRPAAFEFSHTRPQNKRQIREQLYSRLEEVERHYNARCQARQLPRLTLLNMLRLCARPVTLLLFVPFLRVLSHRSARAPGSCLALALWRLRTPINDAVLFIRVCVYIFSARELQETDASAKCREALLVQLFVVEAQATFALFKLD